MTPEQRTFVIAEIEAFIEERTKEGDGARAAFRAALPLLVEKSETVSRDDFDKTMKMLDETFNALFNACRALDALADLTGGELAEGETVHNRVEALMEERPSPRTIAWIRHQATCLRNRISHVMDDSGRQAIDEIRDVEEWLKRVEKDQ